MFTWKNYLYWSNHREYLAAIGNWAYVNYTDVFWLSLFIFCFWSVIKINSLRYKFIYFLLIVALLGLWGYWACLDGLVLMMFLTELLVILLFLFSTTLKGFSHALEYILYPKFEQLNKEAVL